ncbi:MULTISPECIES: dihydrofolate reductase family protein [unclassified Synechococcus]|uniref:RibD family protein n=1 Tax=unclassified Synechococcus TaxID=2626047 RepID=UPI000069865F|nr:MULTISPECIES: dihydrofolate reductase family protein [unclassified Synechococcus]EAQ75302.1 RibD/ribG C-terminal domain protein [Synechococcus sp. WH 5701]WFN59973.1 dihydrofolate reductase family protein [Synechococcus sp. CCFWC 502]
MSLPQLRLVLAISLDGRLAPAHGGAAQLGGVGDRTVLEEALAWADGCLVGAATVRVHRSTCLIHRPELLAQRRLEGRSPQPITVVVSRGRGLEPGLPFFSQPLERWLLSPGPAQPAFDAHLDLGDWPSCLEELGSRGLRRLVLLGGAELATALLVEGLVQELQLSLCPLLLGGRHGWVSALAPDLTGQSWELIEHRPLGGGEMLLRYRCGAPCGAPTGA